MLLCELGEVKKNENINKRSYWRVKLRFIGKLGKSWSCSCKKCCKKEIDFEE